MQRSWPRCCSRERRCGTSRMPSPASRRCRAHHPRMAPPRSAFRPIPGAPIEDVGRNHTRPEIESSAPNSKIRPVVVGFAAVENGPLRLPAAAVDTGRDHAEREMRGIEPVMRNGRQRIRHRGYAMRDRQLGQGQARPPALHTRANGSIRSPARCTALRVPSPDHADAAGRGSVRLCIAHRSRAGRDSHSRESSLARH